MAELSNLAQVIAQYNQIHGTNINPQAPWTTPGWDGPNGTGGPNSLHGQIETLGANGPTAADQTALAGATGNVAGPGGGLTGSLSNLFSSPEQLQAFAPQNYQSFGQIPYVDPTYATAATGQAYLVDPRQVNKMSAVDATAAQTNYSTLPDALKMFQQQIATGLDPQFQRQEQAQNEQMAGRGLFNSGAAIEGSNDLRKQQDSALAQALAPLTEQFASYYQQDQLGNTANQQQTALSNQSYQNSANAANQAASNSFLAGNQAAENNQRLTNEQYQQQTGQSNAAAANQAAGANAAAYGNVTQGNQQNYNNFLQTLMQYQQQQNQTQQGAYLGSYGANNSAVSLLGNYGSGSNPYANAPNNGAAIGSAITGAINSFGPKKPITTDWSPTYTPAPTPAPWMGSPPEGNMPRL